MGYVATQTVHTAEGGIVGPGEEVGEKFDPKAEHNAELIEAGALRPSESAESSPKSSSKASPEKKESDS